MRVRFVFDGVRTDVAVADAVLAGDVAALFPGGRVEESSGTEPGELTIVSSEGGFEFASGGDRHTFSSVPDLLAAVEFAVVNRLLTQDERHTHVHAAGVWTPHGAVLVTGPSGAGKSSLALAWSLAGLPLLGDDVVLLDDAGRVSPFPRLLKVHPRRLTEPGLSLEDTPAWDPGSDEAWFDPANAGGWAEGWCRASLLAQVEYDGGDGVRIEEGDAALGLRLLLDAVLGSGNPREKSVDRFISLLEGVRVLRVRFDSAVELARRLVERIDP